MPGSMRSDEIDENPSRRVFSGGRSPAKNTSPGSISTPRSRARAASWRVSSQGGPSSQKAEQVAVERALQDLGAIAVDVAEASPERLVMAER
jgi:hypothetical protein